MRSRADDCSKRSGEAVKWLTRRSPGRAARRSRWVHRSLVLPGPSQHPTEPVPAAPPVASFLRAATSAGSLGLRGVGMRIPAPAEGEGGGHMCETRLSSHIRPLLFGAPSESVCRGGGALFAAAAAACGGSAPRQTLPPVSTQMSAGLRAWPAQRSRAGYLFSQFKALAAAQPASAGRPTRS